MLFDILSGIYTINVSFRGHCGLGTHYNVKHRGQLTPAAQLPLDTEKQGIQCAQAHTGELSAQTHMSKCQIQDTHKLSPCCVCMMQHLRPRGEKSCTYETKYS